MSCNLSDRLVQLPTIILIFGMPTFLLLFLILLLLRGSSSSFDEAFYLIAVASEISQWVFNVINLFRVVIGISSDIHKARCGATDWRRSKCILVVI